MNTTSLGIFLANEADRIRSGGAITRTDAERLLTARGPELAGLFAAATKVRHQFRGDTVDLCSIINAKSGACTEDCSYCAQSVHYSTGAPVYPLVGLDRMAEAAASAKKNGARRFCIVTSGRGVESREDLATIAAGIRRVLDTGLFPCATLGTLEKDQLAFLRDAGLDRYHHNIETSRSFFPNICRTHAFEERLRVLDDARNAGLSICSGGILGMGETMRDRIEMAFTLRELDVDSVPLNFLMRIPGTPLENAAAIPPLDALHAIALFRLILPNKEIRVCGGRGNALGLLHPMIFFAGADGFMIGNYLTRNGLDPHADLQMIRDLGLHL